MTKNVFLHNRNKRSRGNRFQTRSTKRKIFSRIGGAAKNFLPTYSIFRVFLKAIDISTQLFFRVHLCAANFPKNRIFSRGSEFRQIRTRSKFYTRSNTTKLRRVLRATVIFSAIPITPYAFLSK